MNDTSLADWKMTTEILLGDATRAAGDLDQKGDDYARRTYVRTVFAFIEGSTHGMKRLVLHMHQLSLFDMASRDQQFLSNEKPNANGGVRKHFLPFKDNLKRTIKLFSAAHRFSFSPDYSHAWQDLVDAQEIRSRLVHPKCVNDLLVSDEDLETVQRGANWYMNTRSKLMKRATEFVKSVALKSRSH